MLKFITPLNSAKADLDAYLAENRNNNTKKTKKFADFIQNNGEPATDKAKFNSVLCAKVTGKRFVSYTERFDSDRAKVENTKIRPKEKCGLEKLMDRAVQDDYAKHCLLCTIDGEDIYYPPPEAPFAYKKFWIDFMKAHPGKQGAPMRDFAKSVILKHALPSNTGSISAAEMRNRLQNLPSPKEIFVLELAALEKDLNGATDEEVKKILREQLRMIEGILKFFEKYEKDGQADTQNSNLSLKNIIVQNIVYN
jgi:hypothetical protein